MGEGVDHLLHDATARGGRVSTASAGPPDPIRDGDRLDPEIFQLPAERMKAGYYSDKYFVRARDVLIADGHDPVVTIQVF